jgi:transposase
MRMTTPTTEVRMRGDDREDQGAMWSYVPMERRIPADHPLRAMRPLVDARLRELSPRFDELYSRVGRPSIAPEKLLRALLLQVLYTIRSERLLMEQLDYNLLFRWFVGLEMERSGLERHRVHEESGAPAGRGDCAGVLRPRGR